MLTIKCERARLVAPTLPFSLSRDKSYRRYRCKKRQDTNVTGGGVHRNVGPSNFVGRRDEPVKGTYRVSSAEFWTHRGGPADSRDTRRTWGIGCSPIQALSIILIRRYACMHAFFFSHDYLLLTRRLAKVGQFSIIFQCQNGERKEVINSCWILGWSVDVLKTEEHLIALYWQQICTFYKTYPFLPDVLTQKQYFSFFF